MATLYPAQSVAMDWNEAKWSLADDNAQDQAAPGAGDNAYFTANSNDVTLTASVTINQLQMNASTDYAGTLTINAGQTLTLSTDSELDGTITIAGTGVIDCNAVFETHNAITGAGTIRCSGEVQNGAGTDWSGFTGTLVWDGAGTSDWMTVGTIAMGDVQINGAGTLTMTSAQTVADLTLTGGTLAGSTLAITATGNFVLEGATLTGSGAITISGNLTVTSGTWSHTGPVSQADGQATLIDIADAATLTMLNDWDLGTSAFNLRASGAGTATFDATTFGLRCGAVTLGNAGTNGRWGSLDLGEGSHSFASFGKAKADDTSGNVLALGSSYVECSGTFDMGAINEIAHTAAFDDVAHIVCTGTGEVTNFAPGEIVHVHGDASVNGGGNGGAATFNTHTSPGSSMLTQVGV